MKSTSIHKISATLLSVALLLSLSACNLLASEERSESASTTVATTSTVASSTESAETTEASGSGWSPAVSSGEINTEAPAGGGEIAEVPTTYKELHEGDPAPTFEVSLSDGSTFRLGEHRGEVVVLNFWATWCGPCCEELPDFQRLQGDGVLVVPISSMEEPSYVKEFVQSEGLSGLTYGCDPQGNIASMYPSQYIPYTLIIDPKGNIDTIFVGMTDYNTVKNIVDSLYEQ